MSLTDDNVHAAQREGDASRAAPEVQLKGKGLAPGVGLGQACFYRAGDLTQDNTSPARANEAQRLREALAVVGEQLGNLADHAEAKLGREAGDIFRAQRMMLNDAGLQRALMAVIEDAGESAESAVCVSFDRYQGELQVAATAYLRERAGDLAELKQRVLEQLASVTPYLRCSDSTYCRLGECRLGREHILIASRLTAAATIQVDRQTSGFLVESGGPSSHAAILARRLGLPAVSGLSALNSVIPLGSQILIDGETGDVFVNPSSQTLRRYHSRVWDSRNGLLEFVPSVPQLKVMADIDRIEDVAEALRAQAEGIGLYRTEIEALARGRPLTEDEQGACYAQLLDRFPGPVYIRLLDLGADKSAAWLNLPAEENPALGCRGARLLLAQPHLLRAQARALARASAHWPIHVIYPMIVGEDQYLQLRGLFAEATADLTGAQLFHGVMFEVPAAILDAKRLLRHADFGRIGTNDLVQYLFAADRTNDIVSYEELLSSPLLWEVIEGLVATAASLDKPLALCGEVAGDARLVARILRAGIKEVSTHPRRIAAVRRAAQRCIREAP